MRIGKVAEIIKKIAEGFEDACAECLEDNSGVVLSAIREQLYSGLDGDEKLLAPTYLNDEFLTKRDHPWTRYEESTGKIYVGPKGYMDWKKDITPPIPGTMLGLRERPEEVPNLFIDGTFHGEINAWRSDKKLVVDPGTGDGPAIVDKFGDRILNIGPTAIEYFNKSYMLPAIGTFFKDCGYK